MIELVGKVVLGTRTFNMCDSDGVVPKAKYGLTDSWYGGMCKEFRKVKNSGILLCVDKRDKIINLAYVESDLTNEDRKLLGLLFEEIIDPIIIPAEPIKATINKPMAKR